MPTWTLRPDTVWSTSIPPDSIVGGDSALSDGSDSTYLYRSVSDPLGLGYGVDSSGVTFAASPELVALGTQGTDWFLNSITFRVRVAANASGLIGVTATWKSYDRSSNIYTITGGPSGAITSTPDWRQGNLSGILSYLLSGGIAVGLGAGSSGDETWWYEAELVVDYNGPEITPPEPPTVTVTAEGSFRAPALRQFQRSQI